MAAILVPAGLWLGKDGWRRAILVAAVLFVLVVELLNSAVEATVDRISFGQSSPRQAGERHRQAPP
jgi:diacylglycerol kinase (ATP)